MPNVEEESEDDDENNEAVQETTLENEPFQRRGKHISKTLIAKAAKPNES